MEKQPQQPILAPIQLGALHLPNRVAMAPMTRNRVKNARIAPTAVQATYYSQRATAGLVLTEGTWISPQGIGYANVPGIFLEEQVQGWQLVTQAVHKAGGTIFQQLGHAGVFSHPEFLGGALPVGPSAVNPNMTAYPPSGPQPTVTPRALTKGDIQQILRDYRTAAENAKAAGFDGVELHAQHPSLVAQFLSDTLNQRTDEYGGSVENKARFLFEVLEVLTGVWGNHRVSVRITPSLSYSGKSDAPEDTLPTYEYVAEKLNAHNLAFLHIVDQKPADLPEAVYQQRKVFERFRALYKGRIMVNGGLTQEAANALLARGTADLVSFGALYVANPDLVHRFAHNLPLTVADPATYFMGDDNGYIDYLPASQAYALA